MGYRVIITKTATTGYTGNAGYRYKLNNNNKECRTDIAKKKKEKKKK